MSRLRSINFLNSIVTVLLILLGANGLDLGYDPLAGVQEILAKNWEFVLTVMLPSTSTFILRLIDKLKNKELTLRSFFMNVFQNENSLTQLLTIVFGVLVMLGIAIAPTVGAELANAIAQGSIFMILSIVITQVLNPIWHFIKNRNNDDNGNN